MQQHVACLCTRAAVGSTYLVACQEQAFSMQHLARRCQRSAAAHCRVVCKRAVAEVSGVALAGSNAGLKQHRATIISRL